MEVFPPSKRYRSSHGPESGEWDQREHVLRIWENLRQNIFDENIISF